MNIAVFACSNGLGHTRRVIAIASFMFKKGFNGNLTAYLPISHLNRMKKWNECKYIINHPKINIIDFCYPIDPNQKTKSLFEKNWDEIKIPPLDKYDIVWSDNITQIVAKRNDTILTGSFLWYDIFSRNQNSSNYSDFIKEQREVIHSVKPIMVANEYFATPEVRYFTKFQPVGLYRYDISFKEKKRSDLLYSCGLGGEEEEIARQYLRKIISKYQNPKFKLFVEPRLLPSSYPSWVKKADFSTEMFNKCTAAIIRPGLGTISDVLANRGRVFLYHSNNMYEMKYNATVIEQMGLGETFLNPYECFINAVQYINDEKMIDKQIFLTSHLRMDGIFATAEIITGNRKII